MAVLFLIRSDLKSNTCGLNPFHQLLITLMRLRFNLHIKYIGSHFNMSKSSVSRIFHMVIDALYSKLVPVTVVWPERDDIQKTMPTCFRRTFPKCACIIDCFEIHTERPVDVKAKAQTYSNYKSHNTATFLIGISPQGTVSFISKGYGGRTSDQYISEHSGFLSKLTPGDTILADRGFAIKDILGLYGAKLVIPSFVRGKKQLGPVEIETSRHIASVRIHVERVIGVIRQKDTILESIIPITLLQSDHMDNIVHVCCGLVSTCPSVVPFD